MSPNATPEYAAEDAKKKFAVKPTSENVTGDGCGYGGWNDTMPEASLMMDSLSKILRERAGIFTCFDSEATDTASVGPALAQGEHRGQRGWMEPAS